MLIAHLASTWLLVGFIWTIQVVVYPQLLRVGEAGFGAYHFAHCWRLSLLIATPLAVEGATAAALVYQGHREPAFLLSLGLMLGVWLCTGLVQAPLHIRLMAGRDERLLRKLLLSNWLRTIAWTGRGLLVLALVRG